MTHRPALRRSFCLDRHTPARDFDCRHRSSRDPAYIDRLTFRGGRGRTGSGQRQDDSVTRLQPVGLCVSGTHKLVGLQSGTWHGRSTQLFCWLFLQHQPTSVYNWHQRSVLWTSNDLGLLAFTAHGYQHNLMVLAACQQRTTPSGVYFSLF